MKNWFDLPPLGPKSYAIYGIILQTLVNVILRNTGWFNIFPAWGDDGMKYSVYLLTGLSAFVIFSVVIILFIRHGITTLTTPERLASAAFVFCFLLVPVFNGYILWVNSVGLTINPALQPELLTGFQRLKEIQSDVITYGMILLATPVFILWIREGWVRSGRPAEASNS